MEFGERLRAERKRLGLSQADAAQVLGVGRVALGHYENGRAMPTVDLLTNAQKAGMNVLWLLLGSDAQQTAIQSINFATLKTVVLAVTDFVKSNELALDAAAEDQLIKTLYLQFERLGGQSKIRIQDLLRAAA